MIDANAPARPRGLGRWLATPIAAVGLAALLATPAPARQQGPSARPAPAPGPEDPQDEPEAPPADDDDELSPEEEDRQEVLEDTVYVDPIATAIIRGTFDQLHSGVRVLPQNFDRTVLQMARGSGIDAGQIERFVQFAARQLTDRANVDAVANPGASQSRIQAIQDAGRYLMLPYVSVPAEQRNAQFLRIFNAELLKVAPDLLKNNLYARVQAIQAVSRMGDPQALDLLTQQLRSADQPLIVKQLAAEGIKRIARESGDLGAQVRERASNALVAFLRENPEAYWLSQARALQALGTLRQISGVQNRDQAVFANEALAVLIADDGRPETRAWAAWALGMFEVPASYPQLNYTLAVYHVGRLAVEVGERIVELSDQRDPAAFNPERVKYLTALIVSPIFAALEGTSELRGSGLKNNRSLGPHGQYVNRLHQLIRQLAASSVELTRAVGVQRPAARDKVIAGLNELRGFLNQNPPQDGTFVPGGPAFALQTGG